VHRRVCAWIVLVVPACFHPSYDHPACGPGDTCPRGLTCNPASDLCELSGTGTPGVGSDAGLGGADGGTGGQADCFQRWFDGAPRLALSQPAELTALASAGNDRDPWLSADGLRLFFDRNPGPHGGNDIVLATRSSPGVDFTTAAAIANLDTSDDELRPALSGDETLLVLSSNHATGGNFQLFAAQRTDSTAPFPSPSGPGSALLANVNIAGDSCFDPFLSRDALRLYYAPVPAGSPQQIRLATRAAVDKTFAAPAPVPGINSGMSDADPALSLDERVIVFSSRRPAGAGLGAGNLWYATRSSAAADFGQPQLIPSVNSDVDDGDPVLSADGCELYFASTRAGGNYHLFHARVAN
jgi:hypothetical protein